jgi:hypothetical protein
MLRACPDRMVDHYAIVGPIEEVRARVDKIWTPMVAFYDLPLDKLMTYNQRIAEALFV